MLLDFYMIIVLVSVFVFYVVGFLIVLCIKILFSIIVIFGYCVSERYIDLLKSILEGKKYLRIRIIVCVDIIIRMLNSFVIVFIIGGVVICYWWGIWLIFVIIMVFLIYYVILWVIIFGLGNVVVIMCYCLSEFNIIIEFILLYFLLSWLLE